MRIFLLFSILSTLAACHGGNKGETDRLNQLAYAFHYRNLDSTTHYARQALQQAGNYDAGVAEALNHLAFVSIARMQYSKAFVQLDSVESITNCQVELLIADIQRMRLCQRMSRNKDFYTYRENALRKLRRITEENDMLDAHQRRRMVYARSELGIVTSTYYYYVGLSEPSAKAIREVEKYDEVENDTAQWLNYLYNVGAGGIITEGAQHEVNIAEMDHLLRCYMLSIQYGYPFWTANSLQAMSEHLQGDAYWQYVGEESLYALKFVNIDNMPDSLLAGNFAERSLHIFQDFGDVYQVAGAYRTLAQCFQAIGDYQASLQCLDMALADSAAIFQAPDLVASIHEQQSVLYAAMDNLEACYDKRNDYLQKQEQTRQDRYLESRAEQLKKSVSMLNAMILAIVALLCIGLALSVFYAYMRRRQMKESTHDRLLSPLQQWRQDNQQRQQQVEELYEETIENQQVAERRLENSRKVYLEQRAKVALVNSVTPLIDRMLHEIRRLEAGGESAELRHERYVYIAELTDKINEYNDMLTQWIQLRQGELRLHIESFPLQELFLIVGHAQTAFQIKGVKLSVASTDLWVKADRVLTLFMINTFADNARKFTPPGGHVKVEATDCDRYVEVAVEDSGVGMTDEQVAAAFSVERKAIADEALGSAENAARRERGHGFGLVNCKGIIEKYKKTSSLFSVCHIGVESQPGKGSRFFFRLPKGVVRTWLTLAVAMGAHTASWALQSTASIDTYSRQAHDYTDSVAACNERKQQLKAIEYADSAIRRLNAIYRAQKTALHDTMTLVSPNSVSLPEVNWYHQRVPVDYSMILTLRNETAIAALALHKWGLYRYNNKVYTSLFKEMSADNTLAEYCRVMQKSQSNKYVAIVMLVILAILIIVAYFMLYYRHMVYYRFCVERVRGINQVLLSDADDATRLRLIETLAAKDDKMPESLEQIVGQITRSLSDSIDSQRQRMEVIAQAEDELRRKEFEEARLHVSNSVLDNCLSTLKHETMYYPSRIKNMLGEGDRQLQAMAELGAYYKEIYSLLSAQAMWQLRSVKPECRAIDIYGHKVLADRAMTDYMCEILKKQNQGHAPSVETEEGNNGYLKLRFHMDKMTNTQTPVNMLFEPRMENLPFLLCRQIIRDTGEAAGARGCGIVAEQSPMGHTDIVVTLPKAEKKK